MEIRVINIPKMKMVSSGAITNMEEFDAFDNWWSNIDMSNYITPRDFMQFNKQKNCMEWLFAIPNGFTETKGYEIIDFNGGLYAVGTAKDTEDDCEKVKKEVRDWVLQSSCFELEDYKNKSSERYEMAHVITPKTFKEKCGYHLSDLFIPIIIK